MVDFTVAIPTYNGEKRLPEVLDKLKSQIIPHNLSWEVIVVDNCSSTDKTKDVVLKYQTHWLENCSLRYKFEPRAGAAFARQKAVKVARGKYIGFLDDDNLPSPNWLSEAYAFGKTHPEVGAYGSEIQGLFEDKEKSYAPPDYISHFYSVLGVIKRGSKARRYEPAQKILPPAAGLVVRPEAWKEAIRKPLFLNHTNKDAGLASEDLEAVFYIQKAGWEVWHNPKMQIQHKIPSDRCEKEYLSKLVRCIGLSRHHLRMIRLQPWQRPLVTQAYLGNDLYKFLRHLLQHGSIKEEDVVRACDRELLWNSLISPFFLWRKRYRDWLKKSNTPNNIYRSAIIVDFTVAIPTYNGAKRIPPLLDRLREQANTEHFSWEVVVVDNNSTDNTKEVVQTYQENWSDVCTLRYEEQKEQGLAFARQCAIEEANAEKWIGFLDDDVIPATDWVEKAYAFAQTHPEAGAYGGQIHGAFEVDPPENFKRIQSFLAIRERGEQPHLYQPEVLSLPPGAALVVNRQAWSENQTLFGRDLKNNVMLAGEDYEILLAMHREGKEIWYNPTMHVHHQIPKKRLEKEYLIPLVRGCGSCVCYLHFVNAKIWQKPWIMTKIFLGSLRRTLKHRLKYGERIKTDLIAACEMEFFMSSALSPFFLLKRTFQGYSEKIAPKPKRNTLEFEKN